METGRADRAQEAAGALWRFWQQRGHLEEGARWFAEILGLPGGQQPTAARAKALIGAGGIAWWQRDRESAGRYYSEAVDIERALGEPARIAEALYNLAFVVAGEDVQGAGRVLDEALELYRRAGDERGVAQVLSILVIGDAQEGRWEQVARSLEEVTAILVHLGWAFGIISHGKFSLTARRPL